MLDELLQIESLSIVFLGDFNPAIIQPFWLAQKKLIREEEANNAKVDVVHNEITRFSLGWVNIDINKMRCEFKTTQSPYFDPVRDLALSVFRILKETPIKSIGINHVYDLALPNKEKYFDFGNGLAPLKLWENTLKNPRLMQLEIVEEERMDGHNGRYRVRIAPSTEIKTFGVTVNINDHIDLDGENNKRSDSIVETLAERWEESRNRSMNVVNKLLEELL